MKYKQNIGFHLLAVVRMVIPQKLGWSPRNAHLAVLSFAPFCPRQKSASNEGKRTDARPAPKSQWLLSPPRQEWFGKLPDSYLQSGRAFRGTLHEMFTP